MKNINNKFDKKLKDLSNQAKKNIKNSIDNSFASLTMNKQLINKKDIEKWKDNIILTYINNEIDKLINLSLENKEPEKTSDNIDDNKKEYKIESNSELNMFTPKDIQEENKEITRNFQNEAYNYMNANEKVENENVASFLKNVAIISRISFKEHKNLNKEMEEKYLNIPGNKKQKDDEIYKKEFSQWIKNLEKKEGKKIYDNFLNQLKPFEKEIKDNKEQKYLKQLLYDLIIMYFHCDISFPIVEINFTKKEDFNSEMMIDFINRGKNRKVNFVILPSLFSNGNYIQNGKLWVFTYFKNTFRFGDSIDNCLEEFLKEKNLKSENLYTMKAYYKIEGDEKIINIKTNFGIPKNSNYNFVFYLKNTKKNQVTVERTKSISFRLKKHVDIVEFQFVLDNKILVTSKEVINVN